MEENKDYHVYRYGDSLVPGAKLSIEHSVSCEYVDISHLITEGIGRLAAMLQESHDNEQKAYDIVVAAAKQWEQQAVTTQLINRALEYLRTPEVAHTSNQWQPNPRNDEWEEISNRVYKMNCNIREDTAYDRSTGTRVPKAWYVTWNLYLNTAKNGYNLHIAGQDHKRYTDKAAAYKYLAGRKKAYAHETAEEPAAVLPTVDFAALRETAPNVIGWLLQEDTAINYPITQTEDNDYYLTHLYDGTYNKAGCLFSDYENRADFSDRSTIVYGHNMRDGSMFASLNQYRKQSYYEAHPTMTLLTPEGSYVVELFAAFNASPKESGKNDSPWRLDFESDADFTVWLSAMTSRSMIQTETAVTARDKVLTLSTCNGSGDRFIVMGKLTAVN